MGLTVYTGGTFDLFHSGHSNFLRECAQYGQVIVSLNTDEFIADYKGKPPVIRYADRARVLQSCKYVSKVIPNIGGANSKLAIEQVMPNIIAIGSDWATKDYHAQMGFTQEWLDERLISLLYIPYTPGISTTEIKKRLRNA